MRSAALAWNPNGPDNTNLPFCSDLPRLHRGDRLHPVQTQRERFIWRRNFIGRQLHDECGFSGELQAESSCLHQQSI